MGLSVERFLTIISLSFAILGSLGAMTWKLTKTLNKLLDIPGEVKEMVKELKSMNRQMGEIRGEAKQWRDSHLTMYHTQQIRREGD